ncbi:MAG: prefoldin subunit [Candidatus Diapherotrites archaeon]
MANEQQQSIQDFERNRVQLMNVSSQKQQLQMQSQGLNASLEELGKTAEKKVFKAVGPIMLLTDAKEVEKQIKEQKESVDLRVKTLQKQEDALVDKLNKLKASIEGSAKPGKEESE